MGGNGVFKDRLIATRSDRGLSKSKLSRLLGVSTTCVWNWEEGNTFPRPEALAKLAKALGVTPAFLSGEDAAQAGAAAPAGARPGEPAEKTKLTEAIRQARAQIAELAGLDFDRVKIILEYG